MRITLCLIILTVLAYPALSQKNDVAAEAAVQQTIQDFFDAIEKQDTSLFKSTLNLAGQVWVQNRAKKPTQISSRFLKQDIAMLQGEHQYEEKALHYDIKVHKGMAMAWVAYEFWRNGVFSHCGIDAFTLMKIQDQWKIVSLSYSVEISGCDELKTQH
ncbi:MAG: nuclear transport factor 2 family protein [Saprospiraceae bacterium]|nr:nuclear transport factor 2 family protein [Saprospiraceae bacterium]